ncbi:DUF3224 domain-containing protein [Kitasatospora sp. NPDC056138]|uniref:DUF3224 domain-containing protein n=1 Tax=Kitasatospora sp. NPDC056138 TaxID=3345724 RepID=UPI0035D548F8
METSATSVMTWDPWAPQPFGEAEGGPALFRGSVVNHYRGDVDGRGTLECLISIGTDGTSGFTGLERVEGRIGDRKGSFVLRIEGATAAGRAEAALTVVPGSGTGELAGVAGGGRYVCENPGPDGHSDVELDLTFG